MRNSVLRMLRIFLTSGAKLAALLLAVSVISFALVSASPVDPVQQYLLSLGTAVSPEQRAEIEAYLRGEEIDIPPSYRGYVGVAADGIMVGFGKAVQGRLKNRYPKGLRNLP